MIREMNFNHKIAKEYQLNLKQGAYLDYLVKLSIVNKSSELNVCRKTTVARLPVVFSRTDTVYRYNRDLKKLGVISYLNTDDGDVVKVSDDIVNRWLDGLPVNQILGDFKQDINKPVIFKKEPQVNRSKKQPIPKDLRKQVFERDKYRCVNCGTHLDLSVDHITPESKGGTQELSNLQTLCLTCNKSKGTKTMSEWLGVK